MEIPRRESETVEFKESISDTESIVETIAAFANTSGGTIFIGVNDHGKITPLSIGENTLENLAKAIAERTDPKLFPNIEPIYYEENKAVILVKVKEGIDKPFLAKGTGYKRVGKSNLKMSRSEIDELVLRRNSEKLLFDKQFSEATLSEISDTAINEFVKKARAQRNLKIKTDEKTTILKNLDMLNGKLKNAATICFGKNPQKYFTQFSFRCAIIKQGEFIDMQLVEGNLFEIIDATYNYIVSKIQAKVKITGTQRELEYEYPLEAIREAIINSLVHRDFAIPSGCYATIKEDSIEIKNPGLLPAGITIEALKKPEHPSKPRNQLIAKTAYLCGYIEHWGTGTTKIFQLCRKMGLREPEYEQSDSFTTIRLFRTKEMLNQRQMKALSPSKKSVFNALTTKIYKKIFKINERTARKDIEELVKLGYLFKHKNGRHIHYSLYQ